MSEFINNAGYTLIELVVVAAIMGVIAVVASGLFLTSLSGGGKSAGLNEVRTNGDYAITQMERMIRNAVRVDGTCVADMTSLTILNRDGGTTVFDTVDDRVASNSGYLTSGGLQVVGSAIDFDCVVGTGSSPTTVSIGFVLGKVNELTNKHEEVEVEFETSVQLRTY